MNLDQSNHNLNSATPILTTNLDILWTIFDILVENDENLRLIMLRHASQVCTTWRSFLLSTPSFWGKSLNFDVLMHKEAWRDEVIRRSGEAFAYVTRVGAPGRPNFNKNEETFLGTFVKENWRRIRYLKICVSIDSIITQLFDISLLQSPHPHIEHLEFQENLFSMLDENQTSQVLVISPAVMAVGSAALRADFGGHAPCLREYLISGRSFQFPSHSSWFGQLHKLKITLTAWTTPCVLDALRHMKSVEHLELNLLEVRIAHPEARARISTAVLPGLKYLEVFGTGNTPESIDLVNYIKPAPICSKQVVLDFWDTLSDPDIKSIVRALTAFPLDDADGRKGGMGRIEVYNSAMRIRKSPRYQLLLRGPFEGNLWMPCFQHFAASSSYFHDVANVCLNLGLQVVASIPETDTTFTRILSNMTSAVHLSTDWITLGLLRRLSVNDGSNPESNKVLPVLESLSIWPTDWRHDAYLNDLEALLHYRAAHNFLHPIKHVRIHRNSEEYPDLQSLQRLTDLEVKVQVI
ncbi:hypothetical protein CPC08DRAFT_710288 [Agrocybe pediades]|nr:hypothetical protein CPC08DRAFT_710288 [Agrocybe pediades]